MDPNANLSEQREIVAASWERQLTRVEIARLGELTSALDGWLSNGGFLPKAWERKQ